MTDVAPRYGVTRQTVHRWLRLYARSGLGGLVDRSSRPDRCPHRMAPVVEVRILELRRSHPPAGSPHHPPPPSPGAAGSASGPLFYLSLSYASWPGGSQEAQAQTGRLPQMGKEPVHGALADGHHGGSET